MPVPLLKANRGKQRLTALDKHELAIFKNGVTL